jgi:hypothetical protein
MLRRFQFGIGGMLLATAAIAVAVSIWPRNDFNAKIEPGDRITFGTRGTNETGGPYTVATDGTIRLSDRVAIKVAGLTESEAASVIEAHLKRYYRNPTISDFGRLKQGESQDKPKKPDLRLSQNNQPRVPSWLSLTAMRLRRYVAGRSCDHPTARSVGPANVPKDGSGCS